MWRLLIFFYKYPVPNGTQANTALLKLLFNHFTFCDANFALIIFH